MSGEVRTRKETTPFHGARRVGGWRASFRVRWLFRCFRAGPQSGSRAGRYLASFAWRYNRRYQLQTMIPRFVHSAARTQPMPYRLLIAG